MVKQNRSAFITTIKLSIHLNRPNKKHVTFELYRHLTMHTPLSKVDLNNTNTLL